MRTRSVGFLVGLIAAQLLFGQAIAWVNNGTKLCPDPPPQQAPAVASTGVGGAFIPFITDNTVVCQYVTAGGSTYPPQFACGDTLVFPEGFSSLSTGHPRATPVESGGAVIAFEQSRNGSSLDIFAQAVDVLGTPLWGGVGVPVCTASGDQRFATRTYGTVAPDGQSGCYIVWEDPRLPGNGYDVFIQHLTKTGSLAAGWPVDGLQLTNQVGDQRQASVVSDDAGGAIIVWQGGVPPGETDIFASRITAAGTLAPGWVANGNVVCAASGNQVRPVLTKDGAGGAIMAWADDRGADIYAQHILGDGSADLRWSVNGVPLTSIPSAEIDPEIAPDGGGGAFVVWTDSRASATSPPDVYAQHVVGSGVLEAGWPADGLAISTELLDQAEPRVISDGTGGMITCWTDARNGTDTDIYAQRVTAGGVPLWTSGGLAMCTAARNQDQLAVAPDGYGGALMVWRDFRSNAVFPSVFAQRVGHGAEMGSLLSVGGRTPTGVMSVLTSPNPAHEATRIIVMGARPETNVSIFDVEGRQIRSLAGGLPANGERGEIAWDLRDESGRRVTPGLYWVRARSRSASAQSVLIALH